MLRWRWVISSAEGRAAHAGVVGTANRAKSIIAVEAIGTGHTFEIRAERRRGGAVGPFGLRGAIGLKDGDSVAAISKGILAKMIDDHEGLARCRCYEIPDLAAVDFFIDE